MIRPQRKHSIARLFVLIYLVGALFAPAVITAQDDFSLPGDEEPVTAPKVESSEDAAEKGSQSLFDMIKQGGWSMYVLGAFSLAVIGLLVYCLIDLQKKNFYPDHLVQGLRPDMEAVNLEGAISKVQGGDSCLASLLRAGYDHVAEFGYESIKSDDIRLEMATAAKRFNSGRVRIVNFFSIIAQAAPMMGLLGTVSGMIGAFGTLSSGGTGDPSAFAGDISEALVTTASGLVVALPSIFCYFIFRDRLSGLVSEADMNAKELLTQLRRSSAGYQ